MGEFKTTPALSTTAGSTTPTLLKDLHAATAEAAGIPLDSPFSGKQLLQTADATATPTASKVVQADAGGKVAAGWLPDIRCYAKVAAQVVVSTFLQVAIQFDTEDYDTHSIHSVSTNKNRFYAPVDGMYMVALNGGFQMAGGVTITRGGLVIYGPAGEETWIMLDGVNAFAFGPVTLLLVSTSTVIRLAAGQFAHCSLWYEGSGSATLSAQCAFARVG